MNPADFALRKRTVMVVLTIALIGAGIFCYNHLGRLEDPAFTIKTAVVAVPYPGASPQEVEEEVTDVIEQAVQSMGQVKEVYSTSEEGMSIIYVDVKDEYPKAQLPEIWNELRNKVGDAAIYLPPGAGPVIVNDDFGDVYGVYFAITGPQYSMAELKDYADMLKKELLQCDDVAKIDTWGERREVIYVEFDRVKMASLGLSPIQIYGALQTQNAVAPSGNVTIDDDYVRISPTGDFTDESLIAELLMVGKDGSSVRLGDIARVYRDYKEPAGNMLRFNGMPAVGLGISTVEGGNVVTMGKAIEDKLKELKSKSPAGMELHEINYQSKNVVASVKMFAVNLIEAVLIVVLLLMVFMGWQSGVLIGVILLLTILATFIGMYLLKIDLQMISLGAMIIALGMLVDNAIVVADGILIRVEKGESRTEAAKEIVRDTQWPLLGATFVAILAFAAIGYAPGNVGEYCRSLFQVMALSLAISWVLAVTITPLFCVWFLQIPDVHMEDPYDRPMFRAYRRFLNRCIHHRFITMAILIATLALALFGFRSVDKFFFPDSTRPVFFVNMWFPQGTHIDVTSERIKKLEKYLQEKEEVKNVSSFIGEGSLRFILAYNYDSPNSSYAQLLIEVNDYEMIKTMIPEIETYLHKHFPEAEPYAQKFVFGPPLGFRIEARFSGPETDVLQNLADQAKKIMSETPNTRDIRTDWRQPVRVLRPQYVEERARRIGVSRNDVATSLKWNYDGMTVGLYREQDKLLPIISRPPKAERGSAENMDDILVLSSVTGRFIPLSQIVDAVNVEWEWPLIKRRDRIRTITVQCNPLEGLSDPLFQVLRPKIEAIELPEGYTLEWIGEFDAQKKGTEPLAKSFPVCLLAMFVTVVWLFNSVRRPLIIFMSVPFAIIGVTAGLLLFHLPFGFMAILGFLGLSGMQIKNAIVLIDQIELDLAGGKEPYKAVLDSAVSRMRPVVMASGTTILGMAPLVIDPFYASMAATIMSGLLAATVLTLIVVPVLYVIIYKIKPDSRFV
ncbi:MAG: efflux RND transporter permease subunit [Spartobacteria bacterium]|nr:efflux RND transporter permease subunit [Spartobacteria bacterium]